MSLTTAGLRHLIRHVVLACLACCAAAVTDPGSAAPLRKVSIAVGAQVLNIAYPWLLMPKALGYWQAEGYDVDIVGLSGSAQALQVLAGGGVQLAQINATDLIRANADRKLPVRALMNTEVIGWGLAVLAGGPITDVTQLRGARIGIVSLATGGTALLQSLLTKSGVDPLHDVGIVAVGAGAPALEALRSGRVQALMFWQSALTGFENSGAKLRIFRDPEWRNLPDYMLVAMQSTITADPVMVTAISRGVAKAIAFANANPDCVRQLQWKYFPATKPAGMDEAAAVKWDTALLRAELGIMNDAFALNGGRYIGAIDPAGLTRMQEFMVQRGLIRNTVAVGTLIVPIRNFAQASNDFDLQGVAAAARRCAL